MSIGGKDFQAVHEIIAAVTTQMAKTATVLEMTAEEMQDEEKRKFLQNEALELLMVKEFFKETAHYLANPDKAVSEGIGSTLTIHVYKQRVLARLQELENDPFRKSLLLSQLHSSF